MKQRGFFDEDERLQELSAIGDPLEKLPENMLKMNYETTRLF